MDDGHWTLEKEMQELIDGLQYLDPGDEDYDKRLRALKEVNAMIPKVTAKDEIEAKKADTEARKAEIEARKAEMELQRDADSNRIHWPKIFEASVPILVGIGATAIGEALGLIFTSRSTFFWRK